MSDLRATERLLEVIESNADRIISNPDNYWTLAREMELAARELRRRGDTLVRRDDLRYCLEHTFDVKGDMDAYHQHRDRLEIALGGKLR